MLFASLVSIARIEPRRPMGMRPQSQGGTRFDKETLQHEISFGEKASMRLIQAKRASEVLSVSLARLYELARLGIIPVVRLGPRQIRFDEDALTEWAKHGGLTIEGNRSVPLGELTRGRNGLASADQS